MIEAFLLKTIKRLRKEAPRRLKELRSICDELIEKAESTVNPSEINSSGEFFEPLCIACSSKQYRLIEIALEAWYFLIEHGLIKNDIFSLSSTKKSDTDLAIDSICKCSDEFDENIQLLVIKCLLTAITSLDCGVHGTNLLLCIRACFHINLMSKNAIIKTTAKAALTQMINIINQRMEMHIEDSTSVVSTAAAFAQDRVEVGNSFSIEQNDHDDSESLGEKLPLSQDFCSLFHRDSYLVFRALCKMSMKGVAEEQAQDTNVTYQNKVLSLELILNLLQNCGLNFKTNEKFIYAVRNYLCVSLLNNCTSQLTQVTGLSLQIFLLLVENFKQHLKSEVEVFLSTIFIRILESENSTYEHKLRVLEVFQTICNDPLSQAELFVNYDCDFDATNLFSRMVSALARIAKNPIISNASRLSVDFMASSTKKLQNEDVLMRTSGLEVLVTILRSLAASINLQSSYGASQKDESKTAKQLIDPSESIQSLSSPHEASEENITVNIVEAFDKKVKIQEEIEMGILRFNMSPMKGLKYLSSHGHIELTPIAVASFLHHYQEKLDKTSVGDLLGREKEYENGFCYHVLSEYVEAIDFSLMTFDQAIRHFLYRFRLPGEAQKIDRIMEKFAERYYLQHKDQFASADMAFILAFSTIMLQTNLHNPAIKDDKRMTKEQFIKQNKGISSDGELSDELLSAIYDNIASEPISFTADVKKAKKDENAFVIFQSLADRKKKDAFNIERKEMVRAGEALIRQNKKRNSTFVTKVSSTDESFVRPMFELVWPPVVGVVSHLLESFDDTKIIELCIQAFQFSIGLSCRLDCSIARNTFVNALAKFTSLDTVREMKQKNVLCIKLILQISVLDGDYLDECWTQILQCISLLSRLQMFGNGTQTDEIFLNEMSTISPNDISRNGRKHSKQNGERYSQFGINSSLGDPFSKLFVGPSRAETNRLLEEANAEILSKDVDPILVDKVFLNSVNLSTQSVIHFVRGLCEVSTLEISLGNSINIIRGRENFFDLHVPRTFSLQKIVEVADYNMNTRLRMEWTSMWKFLEEHFTSIGLHENKALAMYAIDSLKQLSIKFLRKDELSNFSFQRLFLKPFETIIADSNSVEIKDLVLRCIDIMIKACASNIRSGWKTIFSIIGIAACQSNSEVAIISFDIIERLMKENFELLVHDFVELMNCLVAFASSAHTQLSLRALPYMHKCADHLAQSVNAKEKLEHEAIGPDGEMDMIQVDQDASIFRLWWPLLLGLSTRISDSRSNVRVQALEILRSILMKHGQIFSSQTWSVIFKGVLFPIIDSAKTEDGRNVGNNDSWVGTMALLVLQCFSDLYISYQNKDSNLSLLSELLNLFENCICQEVKLLSTIAIKTFRGFVFELGLKNLSSISQSQIDLIIGTVKICVSKNLVFNFDNLGVLSLPTEKMPKEIQEHFFQFPSGSNEIREYTSPYGNGVITECIKSLTMLDVRPRAVVKLNWGGMLYTCDDSAILCQAEDRCTNKLHDRTVYSSVIAMSTIVVELINFIGEFCVTFRDKLAFKDFRELLLALELCHWNALSFNENLPLRLRLFQISKEKSHLPHLLEQEVLSLENLLSILFSLYLTNCDADEDEIYKSWTKRVSTQVIRKFILLEDNIARDLSDNESGEENDDRNVLVNDHLDKARHHAYVSPIISLLENILKFSELKFKTNKSWVTLELCNLIRCTNLPLRLVLQNIYIKHINPFFNEDS